MARGGRGGFGGRSGFGGRRVGGFGGHRVGGLSRGYRSTRGGGGGCQQLTAEQRKCFLIGGGATTAGSAVLLVLGILLMVDVWKVKMEFVGYILMMFGVLGFITGIALLIVFAVDLCARKSVSPQAPTTTTTDGTNIYNINGANGSGVTSYPLSATSYPPVTMSTLPAPTTTNNVSVDRPSKCHQQ